MLSALTLADGQGVDVTLHETSKRALSAAVGLVGISSVRHQPRVRPQGHGSINPSQWTEGNVIALEGDVWSPGSIEGAFAEFRLISKPMIESLSTPALMKWTEGLTGNALQTTVKLAGPVQPHIADAAALLRYAAQFYAEDPRAYSQTLTTVTGAALSTGSGGKFYPYTYPRLYTVSGGGTAVCVNAGNAATPPILRIYGYCTAPSVQLTGSGRRIAFTGEVGAGDYLEIDTARRTVKLNGTTNRRNLLDSVATSWFELPAGSSTVQLLSSNFDANARVDAIYRSAYR